jgi:ABC-type glutathione transport system ATPase component
LPPHGKQAREVCSNNDYQARAEGASTTHALPVPATARAPLRRLELSSAEGDPSPLVVVEHLTKTYRRRRGLTNDPVHALVGQSGSGKSTIAKTLTGTVRPTSGILTMDGKSVIGLWKGAATALLHGADGVPGPFAALNPTTTIGGSLSWPLKNLVGLSGSALRHRIIDLLETVGPDLHEHPPHPYDLCKSGTSTRRRILTRYRIHSRLCTDVVWAGCVEQGTTDWLAQERPARP